MGKHQQIADALLRCYYCGQTATVLHHVRNRGLSLKDELDANLAPLCELCHRRHHGEGKETFPARMGRPVLTRESLRAWEGE